MANVASARIYSFRLWLGLGVRLKRKRVNYITTAHNIHHVSIGH